jgi:hypothetical protein
VPASTPTKKRLFPLAVVLGGGAAALLWLGLAANTRPASQTVTPIPPRSPTPRPAVAFVGGSSELDRLRAENARLLEQLAAKETERHETKEELADALHELSELRRPMEIDMASSTLRANLKPGEGVVTGGYRLPDGSRLFAFLETSERSDGGIGVMGRFFSVPDADAQTLGLGNLLTEAANTIQHGEVWVRDEINDVTRQIGQTGRARAVGLGATALQPGNAAIVPLESTPPLTFRVYAERDAQNGLELELRVESVPKEQAPGP